MKRPKLPIALLVLLATIDDPAVDEFFAGSSRHEGCPVCGKRAKASSGECSHCGCYTCSGCSMLHYGDASRDCPGNGIPLPEKRG